MRTGCSPPAVRCWASCWPCRLKLDRAIQFQWIWILVGPRLLNDEFFVFQKTRPIKCLHDEQYFMCIKYVIKNKNRHAAAARGLVEFSPLRFRRGRNRKQEWKGGVPAAGPTPQQQKVTSWNSSGMRPGEAVMRPCFVMMMCLKSRNIVQTKPVGSDKKMTSIAVFHRPSAV